MHLLTLVELLENEVGSSASARANLDQLLAERGSSAGAARKSAAVRSATRHGRPASAKAAR